MTDYIFTIDGKECNLPLLSNAKAQEISYQITGMVALFSTQGKWPPYSEFMTLANTLLNGLRVNGDELTEPIPDVFKPPVGIFQLMLEAIKGNFPELATQLEGKLAALFDSDRMNQAG